MRPWHHHRHRRHRHHHHQRCWLIAQGAAQYRRPCPFRLFAGGHVELVRYIADLSAYDNAAWVPRPQPTLAEELRRFCRQQQLELHAERETVSALRLELDDAQQQLERSQRREASAHAHAAAEQRAAEEQATRHTRQLARQLAQLDKAHKVRAPPPLVSAPHCPLPQAGRDGGGVGVGGLAPLHGGA